MSRQRDYQPTIDRANRQAEIARSREAKTRAKADSHHREMLRQQAAARIAGEEADRLREQIVILESIKRDLRSENGRLGMTIGALRAELADAKHHPWRAAGARLRARAADAVARLVLGLSGLKFRQDGTGDLRGSRGGR